MMNNFNKITINKCKLAFKLLFVLCLLVLSSNKIFSDNLDYSLLKSIPVQHEGRLKPLDTFARIHLLAFYGKQSIPGISPIAWLMELLLDEKASIRPLFDIKNPDLLSALKIKKKASKKYSYSQIQPALYALKKDIYYIQKSSKEIRTPVQKQILDLYFKIGRYQEIANSLSMILPLFVIKEKENAEFLKLPFNKQLNYLEISAKRKQIETYLSGIKNKKNTETKEKKITDYSTAQVELIKLLKTIDQIGQNAYTQILRIIPPMWPENKDQWHSPWMLIRKGLGSPKSGRYMDLWKELAKSYLNKDSKLWTKSVTKLYNFTQNFTKAYSSSATLSLEVLYNKLDLFTNSLALYILGFLSLAFSWVFWPKILKKSALFFSVLSFLIHSSGLILRVIIMGRAPVATLYETLIVVGLVSVFLGLWIERIQRNGMGIFIATLSGSIMHFLALGYTADGDSMGMLVAVLDSNFWLSTHVVTIVIGYGACLVAGILGHIYLIQKMLNPEKDTEKIKELFRNMLWISILALFFTILGTVLGGIWADQSWGRFWGWDPKENGALLIILWLLFLLHSRFTKFISPVTFALGMVINNIIVALAWFGVNLLNVGLHTYGFSDNIALNLLSFCILEFVFIVNSYLIVKHRTLQYQLNN